MTRSERRQSLARLYISRMNTLLESLGLDYIRDNLGEHFNNKKKYKIKKPYITRLEKIRQQFFDAVSDLYLAEAEIAGKAAAKLWKYEESVNVGYVATMALEQLYFGLEAKAANIDVVGYIDDAIRSPVARTEQYRAIMADIREGEGLTKSHIKNLKEVLEQYSDNGMSIINGKTWDTEKYGEMLARTVNIEANSEVNLIIAENNDTDLVKISDHNTMTPFDAQFEGKIFSVTGKDKRFPPLIFKPPYHPNCLHIMQPVFEDFYSEKEWQKEIKNSNKAVDKALIKANTNEYNTTKLVDSSEYKIPKVKLEKSKTQLQKKLRSGQKLDRKERAQYDKYRKEELEKYRNAEIKKHGK